VCAAERGITLRELVAQALIAEIELSPKVQRRTPTLPQDAPAVASIAPFTITSSTLNAAPMPTLADARTTTP